MNRPTCTTRHSIDLPAPRDTHRRGMTGSITDLCVIVVSFRRPASPETKRIRNVITGPLFRRFAGQAAAKETPLWRDQKPRRLNTELFNEAVKSPLNVVYVAEASFLETVTPR